MDIDQMKSTAQDQIELMMMMSELYSASSEAVPAAPASTAVPTNFSCQTSSSSRAGGGGAPSFAGLPSSPAAAGQEAPSGGSQGRSSTAAMREVVFRVAAMQPIRIDAEAVRAPRRRNVRISKDPQSVAARHRRERISERIRILQRIVPGGTKMDTASMLDEAVHYVKFLKTQVQTLSGGCGAGIGFPVAMYSGSYMHTAPKAYAAQNVEQYRDV